jgi:hypothetical protein
VPVDLVELEYETDDRGNVDFAFEQRVGWNLAGRWFSATSRYHDSAAKIAGSFQTLM